MQRYNMEDSDSTDFAKVIIIQPTTRKLCSRTLKECTYCKYDAPHPSTTMSDWSSEDWDDKSSKPESRGSLIDLKLLEQQHQNMLQDTT